MIAEESAHHHHHAGLRLLHAAPAHLPDQTVNAINVAVEDQNVNH